MRRLGLRTRLTILLTVVFAAAISITSVLVLRQVEDDLVADTEASAARVLSDYLDSVYGGTAGIGVVDPSSATRFFYMDAAGEELTAQEYFESIAVGFETATLFGEPTGIVEGDLASGALGGFTVGPVEIDAVTGELVDSAGSTVTFVAGPMPVGEPSVVDVGPGILGVAQTLEFADGTTVQVGVSSPLQPVTDSIDAIRRVLWFGVPLVVLGVAIAAWLAASRALAPVHAITRRARSIGGDNIEERMPVPAGKDEIRELAQTMNDMLGRLQHSQQRHRQLVADVSHELRSPVAVSRAQLEVAQARPAEADWEATAATVLAEQEHLTQLIDDLLALSRIDEVGALTVADVDLDELLYEEARRPHGAVVTAADGPPIRVSADRGLMVRALRNLVENADRHAHSRVELSVDRAGESAVIHVDDDGPGVPADERERIFERFARLDQARTRSAGGTGLGLAIVDSVVRAHAGQIAVSDSPLGGARFSLMLPAQPRVGTGV